MSDKAARRFQFALVLMVVAARLAVPMLAWAAVPDWAQSAPPPVQAVASWLDEQKVWIIGLSLMLAALAWGVSTWAPQYGDKVKGALLGAAGAAILLGLINNILDAFFTSGS